MILVDPRSGAEKGVTTVDELCAIINRLGICCEKGKLEFADAAFEGNGPHGKILIGIERKTLHDMLNCIDDARYAAHQKVGMRQMYGQSFLLLEGQWKPYDPDGWLMEGFQGGVSWGLCRYRSQRTLYAKLYRYLLSVSLSGVTVLYSRDLVHTAWNICETYQYFQKKWDDHTALLQTQRLHIPDMNVRPSLVRRWAAELDGIGVKHSIDAARLFKTPLALANSDEIGWLRLKGIGVATAQKLYRQIRGLL